MAHLPLRPLELEAQLADAARDRNELVRDTLRQLFLPALAPDQDETRLPASDVNLPDRDDA
ncbi:MAG: hypothetical protein ACODAB_09080 [Gemmatimonadota bacterium]